MSVPQARRDGYGRPLPELTDAAQAPLGHLPHNQELRRDILALLEEQFQVLLRRGMFADLHLVVMIRDGRLQPDMDMQVTRHYRQIQGKHD